MEKPGGLPHHRQSPAPRQLGKEETPEICINNASSNSRLTAAGRQATARDTIHRTVSRLFFSLFLPTLDERTTELRLHAEKLTETVLHLNLGHFVGVFLFCVALFYFSPLMRQLQNNI
jgi:hypothetical protein